MTEPNYDVLSLYGYGGRSIANISGSGFQWSRTYTTPSNMRLAFRTDLSINGAGYTGNYAVLPNRNSSYYGTCGPMNRVFNNRFGVGVIYSPYYPSNYRNNVRCMWVMQVAKTNRVRVNFPAFSTESGYDIVRLYNGNTTSSSARIKSCSGSFCDPVTGTGNTVTMTFTSDGSVTRSGFDAYFIPV